MQALQKRHHSLTHQQIADWALRFWLECDDGELSEATNSDRQLAAAAEVAFDIDAQWDLWLLAEYSMEELQFLEYSNVKLPKDWFVAWAEALES